MALILLLAGGSVTLAQQPAPAQQQPVQQQPDQPKPTQSEAEPDTSDGVLSLELFYWGTKAHPALRSGAASTNTARSGNLNFPSKNLGSPGVVASFPAGKGNTLRISYFRMQASGNAVASRDLTLFSTDYSTGDPLATQYTLQNVKLSYDYLSYPFPPDGSKFRFRLLFEGQYTTIHPTIDSVTTDSSGNLTTNPAEGTKWFIYPTLGAAVERALSKHFRVEAKASGFGIPHRAAIWDAEALAAYRHGRVEALVKARAFHFKTSPKQNEYMSATLPGVCVGLRWYP